MFLDLKRIVSTAALLATTSAFAVGVNVGNGGALVVGTCDGVNPHLKFTQVLDLYESVHLYHNKLDLGTPDMSSEQIITKLLDRLAKKDPKRAELYRTWANSFADESVFAEPRLPFPKLVDAGDIVNKLPAGCNLVKIVDQEEPSPVDTHRYLINADLFNQLDSQNRAAIILHEVIYRDAIARGHQTSKKARAFLGMIASNKFESLTTQQYSNLLIELGMIDHMVRLDNRVIRLFDQVEVDFNTAKDFCFSLNGSSGIANFFNQAGFLEPRVLDILRYSKLNEYITNKDLTRTVHFFNAEPYHFIVTWNPEIISSRGAQPDGKLFFAMCEQDVATSPWTERDQ